MGTKITPQCRVNDTTFETLLFKTAAWAISPPMKFTTETLGNHGSSIRGIVARKHLGLRKRCIIKVLSMDPEFPMRRLPRKFRGVRLAQKTKIANCKNANLPCVRPNHAQLRYISLAQVHPLGIWQCGRRQKLERQKSMSRCWVCFLAFVMVQEIMWAKMNPVESSQTNDTGYHLA